MNHLIHKVAFVSPHCVFDFTNGAATATLDGLALLARSGFECQAFCSSRMFGPDGLALLARSGFECQAFCSSRMFGPRGQTWNMYFGVPVRERRKAVMRALR